jgi:hypothetical protein
MLDPILPSASRSLQCSFLLVSDQKPVYIYDVSGAIYVPCLLHPPLFDNPDSIMRTAEDMMPFIIKVKLSL